jgi:hypothetical protein
LREGGAAIMEGLEVIKVLTLQGGVKEEGSSAHYEIADKGNDKYCIMIVAETAGYTLVCKIHEHKVCEGVDNLSRVRSGIIILFPF